MTSKKRFSKKQALARYIFAFFIVVAGILFNQFNIGNEFLGFSSIGTWLIYVGFMMFAVITLSLISNRKKIIDERMEKIGYKASRITFLFIILASFLVMVIDGIKPINVPYSIFMSNMIAIIVLVYFVSYKILEKYYF